MDGKSLNITGERIKALRQIFPEVFAEDNIDFELLKTALGEHAHPREERYELNWAGKIEAFKEIQKQTAATLIPEPDKSIDFDTTQNIFIEGENLETLRVLQKSYYGKIKMIYIDPPYNTGNDHFVYPDDYTERRTEYEQRTGITDQDGFLNKKDLWKKNTKENGQFHSIWLSMIYPRLFLARNLLREDGVIFVSIGDAEVGNLRLLMDTILGKENFISTISRLMKTGGAKGNFFTPNVDYILVYAKNIEHTEFFRSKIQKEQIDTYYKKIQKSGTRKDERYGEERLYKASLDPRANQRYWIKCPDETYVIPPGENYPEKLEEGAKIKPNSNDGVWKWIYETYKREFDLGNIVFKKTSTSALVDSSQRQSKWNIYNKKWLKDQQEKGKVPANFIQKFENRQSASELKELSIPFDYAKPSNLIKYLIEIANTSSNDIILDFFSGSGTTAHAVLALNQSDGGNRKFICVQMPEATPDDSEARKAGYETISDIAQARIRKVIENIKAEQKGKLDFDGGSQDLGFKSFRLAPSNFKVWRSDATGEALAQQLKVFQNPYREDTQQENMLYELLLKAGFPLTVSVTRQDVGGTVPIYHIGTGQMIVALDTVNEAVIQTVLERHPQRFVTLDKLFNNDDQFLTNTRLQLKEADIDFQVI